MGHDGSETERAELALAHSDAISPPSGGVLKDADADPDRSLTAENEFSGFKTPPDSLSGRRKTEGKGLEAAGLAVGRLTTEAQEGAKGREAGDGEDGGCGWDQRLNTEAPRSQRRRAGRWKFRAL